MGFGILKLGGLTIVAALLLSTTAFAQDVTTGDGDLKAGTDHIVQTWHDVNPIGDDGIAVGEPDPNDGQSATLDLPVTDDPTDEGIAVGEPDPSVGGSEPDPSDDAAGDPSDGGPDIVIDDGLCIGVDCTPEEGTDPVGGDGEVSIYYMDGGPCIDCNVVTPGRPINPSEVERTHTAAIPAKLHSAAAALVATTDMAQCLAQHPRSAWICEWQNGAGE